jgi:hypothetical protein
MAALRLMTAPRNSGMSWTTYYFQDEAGNSIVIRRGFSTESGHLAGITIPHLGVRKDLSRPQDQGGYLFPELLEEYGYTFSEGDGWPTA